MTKRRLLRGGSSGSGTWYLRTTDRDWNVPEDRFRLRLLGFRIVVSRRKP